MSNIDNILLIDAKNVAYRTIFASRSPYSNHPFVVWLRMIKGWLNKFSPKSCHIFWDCHKNDIWRRKLLNEYKSQREDNPHYNDEIKESISKLVSTAKDIMEYMAVRQYYKDGQESDDLIYAACRVMAPINGEHRIIIVSSDSDFLQLQWYMDYVRLLNPTTGELNERPDCDPCIQKALMGDTADNIDGFRGIGPVKSKQMVLDKSKLFKFLESEDEKKFKRNLALIDLSLNPSAMSNQIYVMKKMNSDIVYDKSKIHKLASYYRINGFASEYPNMALSFKRLASNC